MFGRTASGVLGTIDLSWSINKDSQLRSSASTAPRARSWSAGRSRDTAASATAPWEAFGTGYDKVAAFARQIEQLRRRRPRRGPSLADRADDALASVEVIEAAYRSLSTAARGRRVDERRRRPSVPRWRAGAMSVRIHPTAIVEDGRRARRRHGVWDNVHIRGAGAASASECIVGEKTYIAYDVRIGDRVKINAFVYICYGVTIEDGVMISAGTIFTNDRFPRATTPDLQQPAPLGPGRAHAADAGARGRDDRRGLQDRQGSRSAVRDGRHGRAS